MFVIDRMLLVKFINTHIHGINSYRQDEVRESVKQFNPQHYQVSNYVILYYGDYKLWLDFKMIKVCKVPYSIQI